MTGNDSDNAATRRKCPNCGQSPINASSQDLDVDVYDADPGRVIWYCDNQNCRVTEYIGIAGDSDQ